MIAYVDTSVVVPLIKQEDATESLRCYLDELVDDGHLLVSCQLLETELRRAAVRQGIPQAAVSPVLDALTVFELRASDFRQAGHFDFPNLGSLDAIHLAAALRVPADCLLTNDARLAEASQASGIPVLDTGSPRQLL